MILVLREKYRPNALGASSRRRGACPGMFQPGHEKGHSLGSGAWPGAKNEDYLEEQTRVLILHGKAICKEGFRKGFE